MSQRTLTAVLLCFALSPAALNALHAADAIVDGVWRWNTEIGDQTINSVLRLESDGKKLSGQYKDENIDSPIQGGGVDDINVWFELEFEYQGSAVIAKFSGEFSDAEIEGEVDISVDGQPEGEFPWNPQRRTEVDDVLGTWDFVYTAPDGVEYTPSLKLEKQAGKLMGTMNDRGKNSAVSSLELKNHMLSFDFSTDYQGSQLDLTYHCKPRGDKLSGTLDYSVNDNRGDFPIVATRKKLDKRLLALVGEWECSLTSPDGVDHAPVLAVRVEDGAIKGRLTSNIVNVDIDEFKLEGDDVVFSFLNNHDGLNVNLSWRCKADGDALAGKLEFKLDGNKGVMDLTGRRRK